MKCRINNNLIDSFIVFISAVLIVCSVVFIIFLIGYVFVHLGVQPIHIASSAFDYYLYTGWSIFVLTIVNRINTTQKRIIIHFFINL